MEGGAHSKLTAHHYTAASVCSFDKVHVWAARVGVCSSLGVANVGWGSRVQFGIVSLGGGFVLVVRCGSL